MEKKNLDWINNLRAVSTIAVIILHSAALYIGNDYIAHNKPWWAIANVIDSCVRFSVPVFVMLSGFLWLSGNGSALSFYKKRSLRLFGPFLFWSLMYYFFNMFYLKTFNSDVNIFKDFYEKFRGGSISFHFWYAYMLIGLFLITPIFQVWIKNTTKKDIETFLIVWVCFLLYTSPLFDQIRIAFDYQFIYSYVGYLVLGYYLVNHTNFSFTKEKQLGIILLVTGVLITIIGTQVVSSKNGLFYTNFYDYLTVNILLSAAGIFMLFKNINLQNQLAIRVRDLIAKYGYGIYLCHLMILNVFDKQFPFATINPLIYVPSSTIFTLIISSGMIYILNKLPFGKYFAG